jgi:thiosulfate/3-mercaptopyruvate sulfurtransferase
MSGDGYAKEVLVTTEWLAANRGEAGIVIAEVDESPDLYDEGHIPGAVKLHWQDDLQDPIERDLIEKASFERLMSSLGIANVTTVVLYGDKNNWFAAYAYWYLKIYGHGDVRILDGGRQKWIDEGRELTKGTRRRSGMSRSASSATRFSPGSEPAASRWSTCAVRRSTRAS